MLLLARTCANIRYGVASFNESRSWRKRQGRLSFFSRLDTLEESPQALRMIIVLAIFLVILAYLAVDHLFDL